MLRGIRPFIRDCPDVKLPTENKTLLMLEEAAVVADFLQDRLEVWPEELLTVIRISTNYVTMGQDLNFEIPIRNLLLFMQKLQKRFGRQKISILRDYISIRLSSLIRGGYYNAAFTLLFASFICDFS